MEECAEWLRRRRLRLVFRSSAPQKVAGCFYPALEERVRCGESWYLLAEEKFSVESCSRLDPFLRVPDFQNTRNTNNPVSWREMRT